MHIENVKQILTSLRSTRYLTQKTYRFNCTNAPRPFYNFLIMLEGEARFQLNEQECITAQKGDLIWIPKRSTYFVDWMGSPTSWYVIHFDFSFRFDPFFNKISPIQKLNYPNVDALLPDFETLTTERNPYLILSHFYKVFAEIFPLISLQEVSETQYIIQPALNYLQAHYKEKVRVDKLANLCFLSLSRFQHLFKELTGTSPISYKNQVLIQHVQQALLIDKNKTLEEIATEFGFESSIYLCRLYKQITGMTPTESRLLESLI